MATHKKGVLGPITSSQISSKKGDIKVENTPDEQGKSDKAEARATETDETLQILKDKELPTHLDDDANLGDEDVDDGNVDDVAQEPVLETVDKPVDKPFTPDISQDFNIKDEDISAKDDAAEPIVQTDKKGNLIFMCNICHTYKGTVDFTRKHQEEAHGEYEHSCKNPHCAAVYKTKGGLNKHIKKHIKVTPTKCRKCDQVFQCESEKCKHSCKSEKSVLSISLTMCQYKCGFTFKKAGERHHHESICKKIHKEISSALNARRHFKANLHMTNILHWSTAMLWFL